MSLMAQGETMNDYNAINPEYVEKVLMADVYGAKNVLGTIRRKIEETEYLLAELRRKEALVAQHTEHAVELLEEGNLREAATAARWAMTRAL